MKIWVLKKKSSIMSCLILLLLFSLVLIGGSDDIPVSVKNKDLPIYSVDKNEEAIISISFDAAWGNEDTEQLIEILNKYNVKTTFFVVGGWVDKFPESVKALYDAGHEIMNHSDTHPHMTQIPIEKIKEEVQSCDDKIEKITGARPFLFRPPYGDYNDAVVKSLRDMGHFTVQWDVDSLDWKDPSPDEIVQNVVQNVKPGSIVLFHNAAKNTPAALPAILEKLQKDGYNIVPISQLIYRDNFSIDHTGKQISK